MTCVEHMRDIIRFKACQSLLFACLYGITINLHANPVSSKDNKESREEGKKLYEHACITCHEPAKAKLMDAPPAFDGKAWQQRYQHASDQVKKKFNFKNQDDYFLYQIRLGKGLMHHGGLCEESKVQVPDLKCTDEAYLAAIQYMSNPKNK